MALDTQAYGWVLLTALQTARSKERHDQGLDGRYNSIKNLHVAPEGTSDSLFS